MLERTLHAIDESKKLLEQADHLVKQFQVTSDFRANRPDDRMQANQSVDEDAAQEQSRLHL